MLVDFRKTKLEYLAIILIVVFAGLLISFYNLSILFFLSSVLIILISFKYFNQVLIILILYLPFQIALNITPGIDLASGRVLILCLFIVWIIKSLAEKKFIIKLNLQTILICLFLFLVIFSITQAWDSERAIRKILVFLSIFPLYFIITSASFSFQKGDRGDISNILNALFLSGFILALIGVIQFALQFLIGINPIIIFWSKYVSPLFYGNTFGAEVISNPSWLVNISGATVLRAFSLFPDPHMFSFYLGLLIPIVLAVVLAGKSNKFLYLTLIIMLLAELLTFSRGGYLGMISGIGVVIILLWKQVVFKKKIILGLVSTVAIIFLLTTSQSVLNRFLSSFDFKEGSNSERLKSWNQGAEMFADNLFFGVGIGNYSLEVNPTTEYRTPIYAHNLYLDIGAEMGIFALIVWILLISITIFQLHKISKNSDNDFLKTISVGLIGSLVWFSIHSFFDTPIYSPTILGIFVIVISLSVLVLNQRFVKT